MLPEVDALAADDKVRRLVLCTGKVYYDLLQDRRERGIDDVALVRVEQLYPWPRALVIEQLQKYSNAQLVWCQEEPANAGAWTFVLPRLINILEELKRDPILPTYVGRKASASPATGLFKIHEQEQRLLCEQALSVRARYHPSTVPACRALDETDQPPGRTMATDIIVPTLGESVTEATVAKWFKAVGDPVAADEPLVELETDKVTVEVNAPASGTLGERDRRRRGRRGGGGRGSGRHRRRRRRRGGQAEGQGRGADQAGRTRGRADAAADRRRRQPPSAPPAAAGTPAQALAPAVRKLIEENGLDPAQIPASGKDGRLTKGDVLAFVETRAKAGPAVPAARAPEAPKAPAAPRPAGANEERVKMTGCGG